jgi:hypothetical protein
MELNIQFKNPEVQNLMFKSKSKDNKNFVLKIDKGGKNKKRELINRYLQDFAYAIAGLSNSVTSEIQTLNIVDKAFKNEILKFNNSPNGRMNSMAIEERYNNVIYDISVGIITESLYLTQNGIKSKDDIKIQDPVQQIMLQNNKINERLLNKVGKSKINSKHIILLFEKYIKPYTNGNHFVYDNETNVIKLENFESVDDEEIYTFFKLYRLLEEKNNVLGAIFINTEGFRPDILKAITSMISLGYKKNVLVFLYNTEGSKLKMKYETIVLPNYTLEEE